MLSPASTCPPGEFTITRMGWFPRSARARSCAPDRLREPDVDFAKYEHGACCQQLVENASALPGGARLLFVAHVRPMPEAAQEIHDRNALSRPRIRWFLCENSAMTRLYARVGSLHDSAHERHCLTTRHGRCSGQRADARASRSAMDRGSSHQVRRNIARRTRSTVPRDVRRVLRCAISPVFEWSAPPSSSQRRISGSPASPRRSVTVPSSRSAAPSNDTSAYHRPRTE